MKTAVLIMALMLGACVTPIQLHMPHKPTKKAVAVAVAMDAVITAALLSVLTPFNFGKDNLGN